MLHMVNYDTFKASSIFALAFNFASLIVVFFFCFLLIVSDCRFVLTHFDGNLESAELLGWLADWCFEVNVCAMKSEPIMDVDDVIR